MKVFLTTAYPTAWTYLPLFERLAKRDRICEHSLIDNPEEADIILFVDARQEHEDWQFNAIRHHPLTRAYSEKTFYYNEMDQPWCAMPGLYTSMPRFAFNTQRQRAVGYAHLPNPYVETLRIADVQPDLLFSFMGRECHPARESILRFSHARAYIEDTSRVNFFGDPNRPEQEMDMQRRHYAEVLARSKFVLCPRGAGPASYRLFETMAVGRVPVIVGDAWVPPSGPDWNRFALIVPEKEVENLPALIEANESRYEAMAACVQNEWKTWFAPDVLFHCMVEGCKDIMMTRRLPEALWQRLPDRRRLRLQARAMKAQWLTGRIKRT